MKPSEPIARIIISDSAMRNFFQRDGRNLRVKIDNNMIYLKSTSYEARSDTIAMSRNRSGYGGDILPATIFGTWFMSAISSAGYRADQPYFKLVMMDRRWIGLEHLQSGPPDDGTEYLQIIVCEQTDLSHKRYIETSEAVELIKATLPVLSEWDLFQIMPRAVSLVDEIMGLQQRLFQPIVEPLRPLAPGSRVVTVEDVARVLQEVSDKGLTPPPRKPYNTVEPLSDEAANALIFEAIGG